jgi:CBS domain-containing protein
MRSAPKIHSEVSIAEASRLMRRSGTAELVVMASADGAARPLGVVTAIDIVTRIVAADLDPTVFTVGDIAFDAISARSNETLERISVREKRSG